MVKECQGFCHVFTYCSSDKSYKKGLYEYWADEMSVHEKSQLRDPQNKRHFDIIFGALTAGELKSKVNYRRAKKVSGEKEVKS